MANQVYKNLGKFMSYEEKVISAGKPSKIMIKYTQPNYQDPKKVWEVGVFEDKISEELLEKIADLSSGEEVCVHTVKNEKGYADLHDISDAKDAPSKGSGGKTAYKKGAYSGGNNYTPRDDTGIAVGAAWTNALEYYKVTGTKPGCVEDVATIVEEILKIKLAQEERVRAAKTAKAEVKESKAESEEKAPSKLEQMKAKKAAEAKKKTTKKKPEPVEDVEDDVYEEVDDDNLDNINFDEE